MKSLLTIALLLTVSNAGFANYGIPKAKFDCTLTELYEPVFDEALSIEEYPDLVIQTSIETSCPMCPAFVEKVTEIQIGSMLFDGSDDLVLDIASENHFTIRQTNPKYDLYEIDIIVNEDTAIMHHKSQSEGESVVGKFKCQ